MNLLARALITFVSLVTLVGSNISDWNHTHILSDLWSPHARFHGAWFVIAMSLLSILSLWLVWTRSAQPGGSRAAALIQVCLWVAFFPAMLTPNMGLADPGREIAPIAGLELNFYGAIAQLLLLALALLLLRKSPKSPAGWGMAGAPHEG
jgi:hypothetical protein